MIRWASLGFSSRYVARCSLHDAADDAFHLGVVQADLGLRFELRLGHLHADDRGHAFAEVLADRLQIVLEQVLLGAVGVRARA